MILEVPAYANDEALGRIGNATVEYNEDGTVAVIDDGRGADTRRDVAGRPIRKPESTVRGVLGARVRSPQGDHHEQARRKPR